MKWLRRMSLTGALGVVFLTVWTVPASATVYSASCATTGANGSLVIDGWSPHQKDIPYVSLAVADSSADGHHVRVRLVITDVEGSPTKFQWHANYDGKGTAKGWVTEAHSLGNIFGIKVQVARFEGDTLLNSCEDSAY